MGISMKNKLFCCVLILIIIFQLCGCGQSGTETPPDGVNPGAGTSQNSTDESSEGEDIFLSLADMPWRDNSLDAYSALLNFPLRYEDPEGAVSGGVAMYILGSDRASVFKKHLYSEVTDCWDELSTVTDKGQETSLRLAFREGHNQAWAVGSVAGTGHYIMLDEIERDENENLLYRFFETDENMQILSSFYVDCLDKSNYELPSQLQVDSLGNLHIITQQLSSNNSHYYIVAPDGSLLMEASPENGFAENETPKLFSLYDGRVGIQFDKRLEYADPETGNTEVLANVKPDWKGCTLWDEKTLLYADDTGLYRSDLSGGAAELIYTWSNHGIPVSKIESILTGEDGDVSLIYMDSKGANYLKLVPTTEEVKIQEISFAVNSDSSRKYQAAVNMFNKKYPAYRIKMQTYVRNDPNLLTELTAGDGPVLVDTSLVGFEENAECWEPLDEGFRQMKLNEELLPQALEPCRINGTLYGIATDFFINTVITFANEPDEWDYDTFLSCFDETDPSMKSVFNPVMLSDGYSFIAAFFYHGLDENFLFDAKECTTNFDSDAFRKILRLARFFTESIHQGTSEDLRQGASLCGVVEIKKPEDMACLRIWGGDDLRFIGYPSQEGSKHYIETDNIVAIRANASAEDKRLAYSFFQFLLSHDTQSEAVSASGSDCRLNVRRDVLEEQINLMNENTLTCLQGFPQFLLEDNTDRDLDRTALYELLEKSVPKSYMPRDLTNIFLDELDLYLSGKTTEDTLIEHLNNRVGLYLSEKAE